MFHLWQILLLATLLAILLFTATWLISRKWDNYSFVDVTWSYSMVFLAGLYFLTEEGWQPRRMLMFGLAGFWSVRLGTYLFFRIRRHHPHEDVRYQVLRSKWKNDLGRHFFIFFQAQAISIVALSAPVFLSMHNRAAMFHPAEWMGLLVWIIGLAGESLADAQMKKFKHDPANKGKVCNIGLWRLSRHPNYFFESVIWWGFWLFACGSPWGWISIYAPLLILYFLLRVTGIPLTEKCSVESKGDAYREYQRTTSAFIPWFPKSPPR